MIQGRSFLRKGIRAASRLGAVGLITCCATGIGAQAASQAAPAQLAEVGSHLPPRKPEFKETSALVVEHASQEYKAAVGETQHTFTFRVRNQSNDEVLIERVVTSCGCSSARLPATPWKLPSGASGEFSVTMDFTGKTGVLMKTATIETAQGGKKVDFRVNISAAPDPAPAGVDDRRVRNLQLAAADRQAVFKGDCAKCHVAPTFGLHGKELYVVACGICHDAEHRASMVPDLKTLTHANTREFWDSIVTHGKPGTLMPAFGEREGGPLTTAQISSLVNYLATAFPRAPSGAGPTPSGSLSR